MIPVPAPPLRRALTALAIATILSLAAAFGLAALFGLFAWKELLLGCALAAINGFAHAGINHRSVGSEPATFLRWGIVMNALRLAAVLATLLAACFLSRLWLAPFALALVSGTIIYLVCNAVAMAAAGSGKQR